MARVILRARNTNKEENDPDCESASLIVIFVAPRWVHHLLAGFGRQKFFWNFTSADLNCIARNLHLLQTLPGCLQFPFQFALMAQTAQKRMLIRHCDICTFVFRSTCFKLERDSWIFRRKEQVVDTS